MSGFVIDAGVAVKWVVGEDGSDSVAALLDHPSAAPDLLCPECANILRKKAARGQLAAAEADAAAAALEAAEVELDSTCAYLALATRTALTLDHPAYDRFCLALAEVLDRPLVTADRRLVGAVRADPRARFVDRIVPLAESEAPGR